MSKMDNLRAMREAKYARNQGSIAARTGTPVARPAAAPAGPVAKAPKVEAPAADTGQLCGHRAISGRTCTREHGHAEKNHRYS